LSTTVQAATGAGLTGDHPWQERFMTWRWQ